MGLLEILREKRKDLTDQWVRSIFDTYPIDTVGFLRKGSDPFHNPIGERTRRACEALVAALLEEGLDDTKVREPLDDLMRIRSVQEFSPSQGVGVIYFFKTIVRKALQHRRSDAGLAWELLHFESKIDSLALLSFEVYSQCRDQLYEIRIHEIKSSHSKLLERAKMLYEPSAEAPDTKKTLE